MTIRELTFKGHIIRKEKSRGIEFYTVDGKGYYLYLKDAKKYIEEKL